MFILRKMIDKPMPMHNKLSGVCLSLKIHCLKVPKKCNTMAKFDLREVEVKPHSCNAKILGKPVRKTRHQLKRRKCTCCTKVVHPESGKHPALVFKRKKKTAGSCFSPRSVLT